MSHSFLICLLIIHFLLKLNLSNCDDVSLELLTQFCKTHEGIENMRCPLVYAASQQSVIIDHVVICSTVKQVLVMSLKVIMDQ